MRAVLLLTICAVSVVGQTSPPRNPTMTKILQRLAQEAESFRRVAPGFLSEETLEQRSRPPYPGAPFESHEVVSEYGFTGLKNAPNSLHEVRKVISVDGKQVTAVDKARQAMTLGLNSNDDRLKKRLLEDFEKHGLHGAATDFGQVILLFSAHRLRDYEFQLGAERQVGADRLVVLSYTQKTGDSGITVFLGNTAKREPLHGEISIRKKDFCPLRITMTSMQTVQALPVREESTVDYKSDPAGSVLPINIVHREYVNGELLSENQFSYLPFRKIAPGNAPKLPGSL